jgi:hypothetical protein
MEVKMISIGHLNVTMASFIILMAGLVVVTIVIILSPNPVGLVSALFLALSSVLAAYNVNCAQLGQCQVWAWVLTGLYVLGVTLSIFSAFRFLQLKKNIPKLGKK